MKSLNDCREDIRKCSKCGLCQSVCPIYEITGNDCTVSRGQFVMLLGLIDKKIKTTKKINRYLDLCLKCGKCTEYCPAGINVVDIIAASKYDFFKKSILSKFLSFIQKYIIFGLILSFISLFVKRKKSKHFEKKVIYFAGCSGKLFGNKDVVKLLNNINIEVLSPKFNCCGMPYFTRGDLNNFKESIKNYINILKKYETKDIVTACASCEKTIKSYIRLCDNEDDRQFLSELKIKNIYEYLNENDFKLKLKNKIKVTYHKPCNQENYDDIESILNSVENLEYIKSEKYDKCCGLNGIFKFSEYPIMSKIYKNKREDIIITGAKYVLTTCLGCEAVLKLISLNKYKVMNLITFLNKNS